MPYTTRGNLIKRLYVYDISPVKHYSDNMSFRNKTSSILPQNSEKQKLSGHNKFWQRTERCGISQKPKTSLHCISSWCETETWMEAGPIQPCCVCPFYLTSTFDKQANTHSVKPSTEKAQQPAICFASLQLSVCMWFLLCFVQMGIRYKPLQSIFTHCLISPSVVASIRSTKPNKASVLCKQWQLSKQGRREPCHHGSNMYQPDIAI